MGRGGKKRCRTTSFKLANRDAKLIQIKFPLKKKLDADASRPLLAKRPVLPAILRFMDGKGNEMRNDAEKIKGLQRYACKPLILLAHPTGIEPVTFSFGN